MKNLTLAVIMMISAASAVATEIKTVYWGTEVWEGYTDKDGSGIYTQLLSKIFAEENIALEISYMPFARTLHLVEISKLDLAGGIVKDQVPQTKYLQSKYPIAVNRVNAYYHKDTVDHWDGARTLLGKKLVATPNQADRAGIDTSNVYVVDTRVQAIQMLINRRADFYLDDEKVLEDTIRAHKDAFNPQDYRIKTVGFSGYYMITPNTDRGRAIMDIYERSTLKLYRSGALQDIYDRFGFSTPLIEE